MHIIPPNLNPGLAAANLAQGLTALTFIKKAYHAQKDDWILIQGASGGVGIWLCRLLKDVGARVIGTAGSPEKGQLARDNGAEFVIDYTKEDVPTRVMELTGGKSVAAVFDSVGAATLMRDAGAG